MLNIYFSNKHFLIKGLLLVILLLPAKTILSQELISAWTGEVDQINLKVVDLPSNGKVIQLTSSITVSDGATFKVVNSIGETVSGQSNLSNDFSIIVTASDASVKTYTLELSTSPMPVENVSDVTVSTGSITNQILSIDGKSTYHISDAINALKGSFLNLQSEDVWLYFDNIKPSFFNKRYLSHISINGESAQIDVNVRLVQYLQGCVVISQPSTYEPLEIFTTQNFSGNSQKLGQYTFYRSSELGVFNNTISSFKLKKGYMATFAENDSGTGKSKVYIAQDEDLDVVELPDSLKNRISFVRVFPWRWVAKKGWTSGNPSADTLQCHWNYNWNNNQISTLDVEYVPIRQTQWWPSYSVTNDKKKSTHVLGFNEPDRPDQANMTVKQAIAEWPNLMQSGLRVGSPAVSDGGLNWLFSFMEKADSAGYRVDFVPVHFYRGGQNAQQYYAFLKSIHDRTGRPIWITEWNNGANWTCCTPTYQSQATAMAQFLHMLDTTSFVERYSLYEWVGATRQMFQSGNPVVLNPAGIVYRDKKSPIAYRDDQQFNSYFKENKSPFTQGTLAVLRFGNPSVPQSGANPMFIDEFTRTGALVQSIPLPVVKRGLNFPILSSTTPKANSDGLLAQSADGNFISLLGYNTHAGSGSTNSATATGTPRVVAILNSDGIINTASSFNDVVSGHVVRGALVNNNGLYMAGGSGNGIRFAPVGSRTSSIPIFTTPGGTRKVMSYGGDIYFSNYTSGLAKIYKLQGSPTSATAPIGLPGVPVATSSSVATGFVMFDINTSVEGYDLLYYADEIPSPAIHKYILEDGTWKPKGSHVITGLTDNVVKDIAGELVNGVPVLYGISFTSIAKFVDNAHYTNVLNMAMTSVINNPAAVISAFRGIAFSPGKIPITKLPQVLWPADITINCSESTDPSHAGTAVPKDSTDNYTIMYTDTTTRSADEYQSDYYNYSIARRWTATDAAGNQSFHIQNITVQDTLPPVAMVKNITLTLDLAGSAMITSDSIDAGSSDLCGPVILSIDQHSFSEAGTYNVVLTATDPSGNYHTATALVEVEKRKQTIYFEPFIEMKVGDLDFSPAGASSGLQVTYTSSDVSVATITNNKIHIVGPGTALITVSQEGNNIFNAAVPVSQLFSVIQLSHTPFNGNATIITADSASVLEAENYNMGGQGNAYWDLTNLNLGWKYRKHEGVDLVTCSAGGYNIDWISFNEWQKYTVRVMDEGYYDMYVNVSSTHHFGRMKIEVEGNAIIDVNLPRTGSRKKWETVFIGTVYLEKNLRVIKSTMKFIDFGVDKYTFTYRGNTLPADALARKKTNGMNDNLSSQETSEPALFFYPNPVKDDLVVILGDDEIEGRLQLFDITGKVVKTKDLTRPEEVISLRDLSSGIYFLQLQNGDKIIIEKIIKL